MRRSRGRRKKLPADPVELRVDRLGHDGRGIANLDGKVAFVQGALPGELVSAVFTNRKRQFDELKTEEVLEASEKRVVPPCQHFAICGGCSMQHMSPQTQIELKENVLHEQMKHMAGLEDYEHLPAMRSVTSAYRRKARLAARFVSKKESVLVGFREKYSSFIADMDSCEVLATEVAELIKPLRELLIMLDAKQVIPQIEVALGERESVAQLSDGGALDLVLNFRHLEPLSDSDQAALLAFAKARNIQLYLQPKGNDSIHKVWPEEGPDRLYYYLPQYDLKMAFHPSDFTQVNGQINRIMIDKALELLALEESDKVLDLFCGLGNFTLPIARHCASVVGVEGSDEMVQRGSENASANGITNAQFFSADLTKDFDEKTWAKPVYNKIVIDPPRSGALEIIEKIVAFKAPKIVYISCNPATLARDAGELAKHGYRMTKAGVMDMFPHTAHVESIAEFILEAS
ncbi:MAG: 23S rRNA (uracil(1939)-C(5))-methyltransferase RlmD [Pseudohongiellaceae bacterium]|nr:23S rRNA (uracil(1939)-C(5))-methyltransferase RlmD [Pseudohongiellaceae bacterium]